MPLFEYRCGDCGDKFEKLVWSTSQSEIVCPKCGSKETERQLSTFAAKSGGGSAAAPSSSGFS
jgi:putative FmdB family regulatory protein